MVRRRRLAALALLLATLAPALPAAAATLLCLAERHLVCSRDGACATPPPSIESVTLWPQEGRLALCAEGCLGTLQPFWNPADRNLVVQGLAEVAPDPGPRLHTSQLYAYSLASDGTTLALSRFDGEGLETTWFRCAPGE